MFRQPYIGVRGAGGKVVTKWVKVKYNYGRDMFKRRE